MAKLIIDHSRCTACSLCAKSCPTGALKIENGRLCNYEDSCTLCGVCADACPFSALSIEKEAAAGMHGDLNSYNDIWVFAEIIGGEVLPVAYELTSKARELADKKGCKAVALLFGTKLAGKEDSLIAAGADEVYICEDDIFAGNLDAPLTEIITGLAFDKKPEIILFGATGLGRTLAPRVAARLKTGLTADCTVLEIDDETGLLKQTRPAFGGNLIATIITPNHRPQMATVRPGVMPVLELSSNRQGIVTPVPPPTIKKSAVELIEHIIAGRGETIADADIIVSVGRGIG